MRSLAFALTLLSTAALAQPFAPQTMRIAGTIERIDGDEVTSARSKAAAPPPCT
jgi:hypothetical protein